MPPRKKAADDADDVVVLSQDSDDDDDDDSPVVAKTKKKPAPAAQKKKPAAAAPKRKPAPAAAKKKRGGDSDDDDTTTSDSDYDDEDDEEAPVRKPPPAKKSKKASPAAASPLPASAAKATPSKRRRVLRADPGREPSERELESATGYWLDPNLPLIWTAVGADGQVDPNARVELRSKVAAFDLDGTLVHVRGGGPAGRAFPVDEDDWVFFNDRVPSVARRYHAEGYEIAIISNQGGVQKKLAGKMAQLVKARAASVAATLGVPCRVLMCPARAEDSPYRKPNTGMWDFFEKELRGEGAPKIDRAACVYVGDAAGRPGDHNGKGADSDRRFAAAAGLGTFLTPEEAFGAIKGKAPITAEAWQAGAAALKAAKEGGDEGEAGPNGALLAALSGVADRIFHLIKTKPGCLPGDDPKKWTFKAAAYTAAAKSIAGGFPEKITLDNLKKVGKLPKVGPSTLERLKECLQTGKIALMEELEGYEAGGELPAAAVPAHVQRQQEAAAAFM